MVKTWRAHIEISKLIHQQVSGKKSRSFINITTNLMAGNGGWMGTTPMKGLDPNRNLKLGV
ncbi:lytic murein transglycosylase [Sesbania bispinosa]|nr:lytic murein transglycosylase [Sesbania bispinosa]